jgi:hypothetical protein
MIDTRPVCLVCPGVPERTGTPPANPGVPGVPLLKEGGTTGTHDRRIRRPAESTGARHTTSSVSDRGLSITKLAEAARRWGSGKRAARLRSHTPQLFAEAARNHRDGEAVVQGRPLRDPGGRSDRRAYREPATPGARDSLGPAGGCDGT